MDVEMDVKAIFLSPGPFNYEQFIIQTFICQGPNTKQPQTTWGRQPLSTSQMT
jgi:hypothetical protein